MPTSAPRPRLRASCVSVAIAALVSLAGPIAARDRSLAHAAPPTSPQLRIATSVPVLGAAATPPPSSPAPSGYAGGAAMLSARSAYDGPPGDPVSVAGAASVPAAPAPLTVTVDETRAEGPLTHVGQGFLHAMFAPGPEVSLFDALHPTAWRSSITGDVLSQQNTSTWGAVRQESVPTTLILSDMWLGSGGGTAPWSNWTRYRLWVESTVIEVEAAGYQVGYWEVYNEPDLLSDYYDPAVYATVSPQLLLQQFLVTYQAIRAVDGSAQIVGPSLADFATAHTSRTFSMTDFLNFAEAQNLQLAALTWHANGFAPQSLTAQVAQARKDLAERTKLGHPRLFVNEYGSAGYQRIPGADVAYLAALNSGGVDEANRSCWVGDCAQADLDGLLTANGAGTLPDYWVRLAYAQMSGERVATTSDAPTVSALASYQRGTGQLAVIIGRAVGCRQDPRCQSGPPDAPSVRTLVSITVPQVSGMMKVETSVISGRSIDPVPQPPSVASLVAVHPTAAGTGQVLVWLNSLADGDAVVIRMVPNG